jgi:hypothetical protein
LHKVYPIFYQKWYAFQISGWDFYKGEGCNNPGVCLASLHQHEHFMIMCIILSHALLLKHIIGTSATFLLHLCYMSMLCLLIIGPC